MEVGGEIFYTYAEAAERLRVSDSSLRKWVAQRLIRHHVMGGRLIRFTEEDLRSAFRVVEPVPVVPAVRRRRARRR
ncbi:helix-turn-helix domain-containing protein [Dactylosporangium sp. NPDC050588]|uniref:helix-turn-helix domain-containing protein n=1 Tax=Dactylosporangium sp. NPDC050588 TaxID=3157211 RepID=UPI0033EF874D